MPVGHRVGDPLDVLGLVEMGVVLGRRHGARHGVHSLIDRAPHAPAPHTDADTDQDHGRSRPHQAGAPGRAAPAVRIETEDIRAHRVAITIAITGAVTVAVTATAADSVAVALAEAGLSRELIIASGLGEEGAPVATARGVSEPLNRSVEIVVRPASSQP